MKRLIEIARERTAARGPRQRRAEHVVMAGGLATTDLVDIVTEWTAEAVSSVGVAVAAYGDKMATVRNATDAGDRIVLAAFRELLRRGAMALDQGVAGGDAEAATKAAAAWAAKPKAQRPEALVFDDVGEGDHGDERPRMRVECAGAARPCPWVGCRHHLYLEVTPSGAIRINWPMIELEDMADTCALDVADRNANEGISVIEVAKRLNVTRQRAMQLEDQALRKAKASGRVAPAPDKPVGNHA